MLFRTETSHWIHALLIKEYHLLHCMGIPQMSVPGFVLILTTLNDRSSLLSVNNYTYFSEIYLIVKITYFFETMKVYVHHLAAHKVVLKVL